LPFCPLLLAAAPDQAATLVNTYINVTKGIKDQM
jgi:hypothetical protein